ncbi:UvrD-helicase domain-containing protein [Bacillus mycoides]|uniref:UvrD-helicase domain-containing protein n=1 Tax=Bacillus mycoides TaxID=1405 RepID=UPI003D653CF8
MDWSSVSKLNSSDRCIPIDQHFKLCAGPGAGKTTFLINHIRNILSNSIRLSKTRKVACITYTNTGVETICNRLKDTAENVEVSTIHSFLYKHIVKPYLWLLEDLNFPLEVLDGHDEVKPGYSLLKEFKSRSNQQWIREDAELANALTNLSWIIDSNGEIQLGFLKPYYGKVGARNLKKDSYMVYKEICWEQGLLSHDDVLYFSYLIIREYEEIREIIRAKFPYFLIDEFQDTSPIQVAITKILAEKEIIVGVIGDPCQSIYSFQGADETIFNNFYLNNMSIYILENNHRSTQQIISLLNHMRKDDDFIQYSPDEKTGDIPTILIGDPLLAHIHFIGESGEKEFCILSYANSVSKSLEFEMKNNESNEFDLFYIDSKRGRMIYYIVHAIEYGKQMKLQDAIKFIKKAFQSVDIFSNKDAFITLQALLNDYNKIHSLNLKEFYNNYIFNRYDIKQKITSGKISDLYEKLQYKDLATIVNISDDKSFYKTIHKAKGDQFENVLVIIPEKSRGNQLDFLLSPDMNKEEHRVYYVALSRAKQRLYINVPTLSKESLENLSWLEINVIDLRKTLIEIS